MFEGKIISLEETFESELITIVNGRRILFPQENRHSIDLLKEQLAQANQSIQVSRPKRQTHEYFLVRRRLVRPIK